MFCVESLYSQSSISAHYNAWEHLSILHRDISGGNVLIYPRVVELEDGGFKIEFAGILADWEMAKDPSITDPRQPERTVSLQHMLTRTSFLNTLTVGYLAIYVGRTAVW